MEFLGQGSLAVSLIPVVLLWCVNVHDRFPMEAGGKYRSHLAAPHPTTMRLVVKIMVPFWVPIIVRHLVFRVPKKEP